MLVLDVKGKCRHVVVGHCYFYGLCDGVSMFACKKYTHCTVLVICTSYHMAARAFADLSHEVAKRPSTIN